MTTQSHERSCTNAHCMPEPQTSANAQSSDCRCHAPDYQDPETESSAMCQHHVRLDGSVLKWRKPHCTCLICQSPGIPRIVYGIKNMVETQSAFPWIDLDDNTGGPIVRAVMSSVSPAVWSSVFQQSAYKAVATYDMAQRRIEKQSGNPKRKPIDRASVVRRAARQRAKRMKRDD